MAAREVYNTPEPPVGFSEPRWAALLFENSCESCGAKNSRNIDWRLLMRICNACKRKHLLCDRDPGFQAKCKGYNSNIFTYVPFTQYRPPMPGSRPASGTFYWEPELHALAKEWKARTADSTKSPSSMETFDAWKKKQKELVQSRIDMAPVYAEWQEHHEDHKEDQKERTRQERLQAVEARFLEIGYSLADIRRCIDTSSDGIYTGSANLTNASWARLRLKLEPDIQEARNKRVASEMLPFIQNRTDILKTVYLEHLATLQSSERYCCPLIEFFRTHPVISRLLEAEPDITITADDFRLIISAVEEYIVKYRAVKKDSVAEALKLEEPSFSSDMVDQAINLARYVFECKPPSYRKAKSHLIGWCMIAEHACFEGSEQVELRPGVYTRMHCTKVSLRRTASNYASKLIELAGLDPATATVDEMDERKAFFVFEKQSLPSNRLDGYEVFTWRGALDQVVEKSRWDYSARPTFRLARSGEIEIAEKYAASLEDTAEAFVCGHCCEFYPSENAAKKEIVIEHLQAKHEVTDPRMGEDLTVNALCRYKLQTPCVIPYPLMAKVIKCHSSACIESNDRFDLPSIYTHLRQKHQERFFAGTEPGRDFSVDLDLIFDEKT